MFYKPASRTLLIHVWEWNDKDLVIDILQKLKPKVLILDCTTEFDFNPNIVTSEFKQIADQVKEQKIKAFLLLGSLSDKSYRFDFNEYLSSFTVKFFPTFFLHFAYPQLKYEYNQHKAKEGLFYMQVNRPHVHRCILIDQLARFDLLESSNYSWNLTRQEYPNSGEYRFNYWKEESKIAKDNYISEENNSYQKPEKSYFTSVFDLVSETTTECIFYSEKTYKPILLGKPFIIYGAKDSNKSLQDLGFKLYDNVVDYTFDSEKDDIRRAELLSKELLRLSKLPLQEIDKSMHSIADFNIDKAKEILRDDNQVHIDDDIIYKLDLTLRVLDYLY